MYSKSIKEKTILLYKDGLSCQKCEKTTGVEWSTIRNWVKKLGITRAPSEYLKGRIPWNKGTKGIMKAWNKGNHIYLGGKRFEKGIHPDTEWKKGHIPWNKGNHPKYVQKENNTNWKGGVAGIHNTIRNSERYKQWRRDVFIRDHYTCQECGHRFVKIVAHHIKSFSEYKNLWFDLDNGRTLCRACHCKLHKPARE